MSSTSPETTLETVARRYPVVLSAALRPIDPATLVEPETPEALIPLQPAEPLLALDVAVPGTEPADRVKSTWEAYVMAGVVDETFAAGGHPRLGGIDMTFVTPDGTRDPAGGGLGLVAPGQRFATVTADLIETVRRRAVEAGLSDVRIETLAGIQEAIVVEGTAASGAALAALMRRPRGLLGVLLSEPPGSYEGVFVAITDPVGHPLLITGTVSRIGCGIAWGDGSPGLEVGRRIRRPQQRARAKLLPPLG